MDNGIKIELETMDAQVKLFIKESDVCILSINGKLVLITEYPIPNIQERIKRFNEGQPYYSRISDYIITRCPFPRTNSGKLKRNEIKKMLERWC